MRIALERDAVVIDGAEAAPLRWPYAAITLLEDEGGEHTARLAHADARLVVDDRAFRPALALVSPRFARRGHLRNVVRALGLAAISAVLVAAFWWGTPLAAGFVAAALPTSLETRLGATVLREIPGKRCEDAAGQAALDHLVERLLAGAKPPFPIRAGVLDRKQVNAFAAPGGYVMLFDGLLQRAQSPDEVAGVLGHELTHALKHHPTRHLVRALGTSLLFDVMLGTGGALRQAGEVVLALSYSRDLEREADEGALEMLSRADIGTAGFAGFFDRLARESERGTAVPAWLRTHPASDERRAHIEAAARKGGTPALSDEEWQALRGICRRSYPDTEFSASRACSLGMVRRNKICCTAVGFPLSRGDAHE